LNPPPVSSVRLDKWLWAVRLFKTRAQAAEACQEGRVLILGQPVKPSRSVRVGEIITILAPDFTRTSKVSGLLDRRVGAKVAAGFVEDLTPPAEYEKARQKRLANAGQRPEGSGRPTKQQMRSLRKFLESESTD
jgi:ribosome-associated heat shock protein Hsp15